MPKKLKFRANRPPLLDKGDKRAKKMRKQIEKRGFADSELWALNSTIATFALPRLKEFRRQMFGVPMGLTKKQWGKILDKIIFAFQKFADDDIDEDWRKIQEGLSLFAQYFYDLWQ